MKITNLADVRPGDIVTWRHHGHEYTGPCYAGDSDNALSVAGWLLRSDDRGPGPVAKFVSAERPTPALPTKPGTVILVHEVGSVAQEPPVPAILDGEGDPMGIFPDGAWVGRHRVSAWQLAEVTPVGEVFRR